MNSSSSSESEGEEAASLPPSTFPPEMPSTSTAPPPPPLPSSPHALPPLNINHYTQQPTTFRTMDNIQRWQNHNFDSGVQTMNHSQAPSVMSMHPSEISTMSGMTEDVSRQELTEAQRSLFERLAIGEHATAQAVYELVQLMKENEEVIVCKAVYLMRNLARRDADMHGRQAQERDIVGKYVASALNQVLTRFPKSPNILTLSLAALFHLASHPEGLDEIMEVVGDEPALIANLVTHMRMSGNSSYKYAFISLHAIFTHRSGLGAASLVEARRLGALGSAIEVLRRDQSEKILVIGVDIIKLLCEKSPESRLRLVERGGIPRLLDLFLHCNYEKLLWGIAKFLHQLANSCPDSLVAGGAPLALHQRLHHASDLVSFTSLQCLRTISDVATPPGTDCRPVLSSLLQLFGHREHVFSLYSVQTISNMIAKKPFNKEFLVSQNAVVLLIRLLSTASSLGVQPGAKEKQRELSEEMQEEILICVRKLCQGYDNAKKVCHHVMEAGAMTLLDRLMAMRPSVLHQTLLILVEAASLDANLSSFRSTALNDPPVSFVNQIITILRVACHQLKNAKPHAELKVENTKVADLIVCSLKILLSLSRDRVIMDETVFHLLQEVNMRIFDGRNSFLPLLVLEQPYVEDDSLLPPSLGLLSALCLHHQVAPFLQGNMALFHILQKHHRRTEPNISSPSNHLLSSLFGQPTPLPAPSSSSHYYDRVPAAPSTAPYSYAPPSHPSCPQYPPNYYQYPDYSDDPSYMTVPPHYYDHPSHYTQTSSHHRPEPSPETNNEVPPSSERGGWTEDAPDPFASVFTDIVPHASPVSKDFDPYVGVAGDPRSLSQPPPQRRPLPPPYPYPPHPHPF